MALGGFYSANAVMAGGGGLVYPASCRGEIVQIHDDLTAVAETATVLLRPQSTTSANVHPIRVGGASVRFDFWLRYPQASTLTTSPVVRFYGAFPVTEPGRTALIEGSSLPDDGTVVYRRLDAVSGAGQTITIVTATDLRDTTYKYSAAASLTGTDMKGATAIFALTETAGVISAGTIQLQAVLGN